MVRFVVRLVAAFASLPTAFSILGLELLFLVTLIRTTDAQFAAWYPRNLTTIRSPFNPNITISYKSPDNGTCRTAFDTQKQYTGWVGVPGPYPTNLFFWFVEARQQPANLTIWLNGGPGASSLFGMFAEVGPCEVVEKGLNHWETAVREWGWDRASNMLFIDQPNQVGFSYDVPTNASINWLSGRKFTPPRERPNASLPEYTWSNGTWSSMRPGSTANTTHTAAIAVWHMLQGWVAAFPQYMPWKNDSMQVNLFAESYGGKYAPIFAEVWEEQNAARETGMLSRNTTTEIRLSSVGIVNGCIDEIVQTPSYPQFAINNTYGLKLGSDLQARYANDSFWSYPSGCFYRIQDCRAGVSIYDPQSTGWDSTVNAECQGAYAQCFQNVVYPFLNAHRSAYDLASPTRDPFPPLGYLEYLNLPQVQVAIGSPINFTAVSNEVYERFAATGDWMRGGTVEAMASLLNRGIRVGLMYGDRDYICNWLGGETVSFEIARQAGGEYAARFPNAGYEAIIVNDTYIGGVVRQFGNFSFSRIYQAGHSVPAYQPETAFQVFARIIMGTAIPNGKPVDLSNYNTTGPANATATGKLPEMPKETCWIRDIPDTCNDDQLKGINEGEGTVINGVWYSASSDWHLAKPTSFAVTTTATTTQTLTGWFTATVTPENSGYGGLRESKLLMVAASSVLSLLIMS